MRVKALINIPKTVDGERVGPYRKGHEFDLPGDLAEKWIGSAMVEAYVPPPKPVISAPKPAAAVKAKTDPAPAPAKDKAPPPSAKDKTNK